MVAKSYYRSLTRSMIISVVLVSLAPLVIISGIVSYKFHTAYREKVVEHLEVVVEKHKQYIDGFLNERLAEIKILAEAIPFSRISDEGELQQLLANLQSSHGGMFVDLGLVRQDGIQIAYAGPFNLEDADYANALWFQEVLHKNSNISDVFTGLRGVPHFIVAVLFDVDGQKWIFRATIDFVAFNHLVENIRIGQTGLSFIINRAGKFQTNPRVDVSSDIPALLNLIKAQAGLEHEIFTDIHPPGIDRDIILVTTSLKNNEWTLVFQQDTDDAFTSLQQTRNLALLVSLIGGVSIVLVAAWRSLRIIDQIRQTDQEKEVLNKQVIKAGKLATVGELAAGIAHEINNPVAIMVEESGWINDILEDVHNTPISEEDRLEINSSLEQIRTQGARCKEITHKLLSFARKTDSTVKEVQLNDLIIEMAALSEQRAKYANVEIITKLDATLPGITTSTSEIQQVLLNLINNAVDAMAGKGGTLTISSYFDTQGVHISLKDTGHGIPQDDLTRIFDPFFTTKPVGKGTGLGLSICYGIINKMEGEISVSSTVGEGTTFTLLLPLDKATLPVEKESGSTEANDKEEKDHD